MADRIIVLNAGEIEQIGTPAEIYHQPASTFVASFMGAPPMNLIDARIDGGAVRLDSGLALGDANGHPSGAIKLGVRPEDVTLSTKGRTPFDIAIVEELGAHRLLHGQLGGQAFTVHVSKDVEVTPGPAGIDIGQNALRLFDVQSGKAL